MLLGWCLIMFASFWGFCCGFVLISSAAGQNDADVFKVGDGLVYTLHATVLLSENGGSEKQVGFFISGDVGVKSVWGRLGDRVLEVMLKSPRLHIKSRQAPSPDGFIEHTSKLDNYPSQPFYLHWRSGKIEKIYTPKDTPRALSNLNKGIASLFQFQLIDIETNETDTSGTCSATYHSITPTQLEKTKTACSNSDLPSIRNSDPFLDVTVTSTRKTIFELDPKLDFFTTIYSKESHWMRLNVKEDFGSYVQSDQILNYVRTEKSHTLTGKNLEEALNQIPKDYVAEELLTIQESLKTKSLTHLLNEHREHLKNDHLGTITSAKAFLTLLDAARRTPNEEIAKILDAKKNQKILPQIYDLLGYLQEINTHETVLKKLHFDREDHLDLSERYLWALSLSPQPNAEIVKDLLSRHRKNDNIPDKVKETLLLTIAAMTRKIHNKKLTQTVEETIFNGLDYAKNEDRYIFLRALRNLQSETSIPVLLQTITKGTNKEGVLAFKTLKSLGPSVGSQPDILRAARKAFFQLDRRYDTSARTLAVDILLEANPPGILNELVSHLKTNDTSYEVKQYLFQRLKMKAEEDPGVGLRIWEMFKRDRELNNYSGWSPKGLSTALKRGFLQGDQVNGSLLTIQEMMSGIVKRGVVNVVLERNGDSKEMFSLGIFAGGLSSFVSTPEEDDDEVATAGMELTILDNQIRPFVFFQGQGELMGHVWSGTASDRTTAFQSLILLQDHHEFIRLGSGLIAELQTTGAVSFDLSGKIEISLWSRNANSLVEKSAGVLINGVISVDSAFVHAKSEFAASVEPKLSLQSDIDFSGSTSLCMRVTTPDSLFRYNIFKTERIPGSKHKMRIAKYKKNVVPGVTYALNKKNNDMCSAMFS